MQVSRLNGYRADFLADQTNRMALHNNLGWENELKTIVLKILSYDGQHNASMPSLQDGPFATSDLDSLEGRDSMGIWESVIHH